MKKFDFKSHYSRRNNAKVDYFRKNPFFLFIKERKVLSILVLILYLGSVFGVIYFAINANIELSIMLASLFVSISTLFAAIYIAWYQQFIAVSNSFPYIGVDLLKQRQIEQNNFMQLAPTDNSYYAKSKDIQYVININKSPCSIIEIKDANNEIYDVDVHFLILHNGKCVSTRYFIKVDEGSILIALPIKDLISNNIDFMVGENQAFYGVAYTIKTKTNEYHLITQISFVKGEPCRYCLHTDVVTKSKIASLFRKNNRRFVGSWIKQSSDLLKNLDSKM